MQLELLPRRRPGPGPIIRFPARQLRLQFGILETKKVRQTWIAATWIEKWLQGSLAGSERVGRWLSTRREWLLRLVVAVGRLKKSQVGYNWLGRWLQVRVGSHVVTDDDWRRKAGMRWWKSLVIRTPGQGGVCVGGGSRARVNWDHQWKKKISLTQLELLPWRCCGRRIVTPWPRWLSLRCSLANLNFKSWLPETRNAVRIIGWVSHWRVTQQSRFKC